MNDKQIFIFDTTLRDGQQSPGAGMTFKDNLAYAEFANLLQVDVLEAGFPAASATDFSIVNTIAKNMADKKSSMTIAALCQLREEQFHKTMEALQPSLSTRKARVHTYVPVDPNLMEASLGKLAANKSQIIADLYRLIHLAVNEGYEVEFSPEGYSRLQHNFDFVTDLIRAAVSAGASVINCPDTIGGAAKIEGEKYFVKHMLKHAEIIKTEFPNHTIIWSTHCHNDFGLALDNSINAVYEGPARQIEGCINGVGERAGNVSLEQCIMYIKQFGNYLDKENPFFTNIRFEYLKPISDFVANKMLPRQLHSPIVGDNATRHSSGGHTNAILKNPLAYQPFDPIDIGAEISFVFGPLSGSNHAKKIIEEQGYCCEEHEKTAIAQAIKDYYPDRRKGITDIELMQAYHHYRAQQRKSLMPKNIIEKIWNAHVVSQKPGHPMIFAIDKMLLHEVTSAQAFDELRKRQLKVFDPNALIATLDHSIPTDINRRHIKDAIARKQVETLRENAKEFGVKLFDFDSNYQGIVHVIGPELGFTQPGMTLVCGDSHTATHGAFGAIAFGVGTSEVAHVLATGCILQTKPKTMKIEFTGKLSNQITAKDLIMKLIATIGISGATGHIIEYVGEAIRELSMEARMTLCNMSIECGARAGLIAPDEITFAYLKGRKYSPTGTAWNEQVSFWRSLKSDDNASYDQTITIDINQLKPMVTWGINPEQAIAVNETIPTLDELPSTHHTMAKQAYDYTRLNPGELIQGKKIDWAFVGSCTNGRIEDLRAVAAILKNRKIAAHVTMYIVPGSENVLAQAKQEGLDKIFQEAGADFRMPGCSMCLAMNEDKVPAGARCISSSNRNFIGRQGIGSITHLAAPNTVAASAVAGYITSMEDF